MELSKPRLRVGFVTSCFMPVGGVETWHNILLTRLSKYFEITGVAATQVFGADERQFNCPCSCGPNSVRKLFDKSDVIVFTAYPGCEKDIPEGCEAKVILVHQDDCRRNGLDQSVIEASDRAACIVCVNKNVTESLKDRVQCPLLRFDHAYDPDQLKKSLSVDAIKAEFEITGKRVVFWCGRFDDQKRPMLALDIAEKLPDDWVMVMAGDGKDLRKVRMAGCKKLITLGLIRRTGDWLAASDVLLHTADHEGSGLIMIEAMRAGVPVVACPVGVASDRSLCHQVPRYAPLDDWVEAITQSDKESLTVGMARLIAKVKFHPSVMAERWQRLLDGVASR